MINKKTKRERQIQGTGNLKFSNPGISTYAYNPALRNLRQEIGRLVWALAKFYLNDKEQEKEGRETSNCRMFKNWKKSKINLNYTLFNSTYQKCSFNIQCMKNLNIAGFVVVTMVLVSLCSPG